IIKSKKIIPIIKKTVIINKATKIAAISGLNSKITPKIIAVIFKMTDLIWNPVLDFSSGVTVNILNNALIINQIANKYTMKVVLVTILNKINSPNSMLIIPSVNTAMEPL